MNNAVKLSVVIVTYNVENLIVECVESVQKSIVNAGVVGEIIIVDNNSTDNTISQLEKMSSDILLIKNSKNLGFPAANNQAFKLCQGEFVFVLNPDTITSKTCIGHLMDMLSKNVNCGVVGPKLVYPDGHLQFSCWRELNLLAIFMGTWFLDRYLPLFRKIYDYNMYEWDHSRVKSVKAISGAAMLFRKSVLDELDGFDKDLFFVEDIEICRRIREMGWEILYVPEAEVVHYVGKSTNADRRFRVAIARIAKMKYFRKHFKPWQNIFLKVLYFQEAVVRISIEGLFSLFSKNRFTHITRIKGFLDVLRFLFSYNDKGMK